MLTNSYTSIANLLTLDELSTVMPSVNRGVNGVLIEYQLSVDAGSIEGIDGGY